MSKLELLNLKSIATIICSESLLNLYDDGKDSSRNYLIDTLSLDDYGDIALSILKRIINFYPSFLTDKLLYTLIPENSKRLRIQNCPQITGFNLLKIVQKCQLLEIFDITGCEQLMLPALFSVLGGLLLNLTTVNISECRTVTDDIVQGLLKNSQSLNHLNVSKCPSLTDDAFLLDLESQDVNLLYSQKEYEFKQTNVNIKTVNLSACENLTSLSVAYICALNGPNLHSINMSVTKISSISLLYLSGYALPLVLEFLEYFTPLLYQEYDLMSELLSRLKLKYKHSEQKNVCQIDEGFCDCLKKIQQNVFKNQFTDDKCDIASNLGQCSSNSETNIHHENVHGIEELESESATMDVDSEATLKDSLKEKLLFKYFVPSLKSLNYSFPCSDAKTELLLRCHINPVVIPLFFKSVKLVQLTISKHLLQGENIDVFISTQTDLQDLSLPPEVDSISDPDVIKICQLPLQLCKIDFTGLYMLSDVSIIPLISENLSSINLSESSVTDITLKLLAKKSPLKWFELSWCEDITEKGISCICKSCALLEYLNLRHCDVNNQILFNIAENCLLIKELNLSCTEGLLDEAVIEIAENLSFLEEIDISWNSDITDKSMIALFTYSTNLQVGVFTGNKRITPEPMYLLVTGLKNWMESQLSKKSKRKQKTELLSQAGLEYNGDEEEEIEKHQPKRSTVYGCNLKKIDLEYVDGMNDELLAWIAAFTFSSLEIIDYYREIIQPAKFRVKDHRLLMP